jgi:hypothetical protein
VSDLCELSYSDSPCLIVEKAVKRGSRKKIRAETMSQMDLEVLYNTLVDHFTSTQTSVIQNPLDEGDNNVTDLYEIFDKDGADMGVSKYKTMGDETLMTDLDFSEGRPVLFAKYRHVDTMKTAWDNGEEDMWEKGGVGLKPLRLLWHQLCGVASIVDAVFQPLGTHVCNRILADDVGIGKSAQVMGVIAFLILHWYAERSQAARPPIIADGELLFMCPRPSI